MGPSWPNPFPSTSSLLVSASLPFRRIRLHAFCREVKRIELDRLSLEGPTIAEVLSIDVRSRKNERLRRKRDRFNGLERTVITIYRTLIFADCSLPHHCLYGWGFELNNVNAATMGNSKLTSTVRELLQSYVSYSHVTSILRSSLS